MTQDPHHIPTLDCRTCGGQCCRYFALNIDTPISMEDYDNLRWYLAHGQVAVFVEDKQWYLQINTACRYLQPDASCGNYQHRPKICRDYGWDHTGETECHQNGAPTDHEYFFASAEELEAYLLAKGKRWASISKQDFAERRKTMERVKLRDNKHA